MTLPKPLTQEDCDLRDFAFMPLDVTRLRDSDLAALETPEACWAAVLLWCASWHQIPAASLPDEDRILANLAGFGRVVKEWMKVKDGALRGWIKCSDGRLYHPVVADKAITAWKSKLEQAWRTELARIKKHNQRHPDKQLPDISFDEFMSRRTSSNSPEDTVILSQGQNATVPQSSLEKPHPIDRDTDRDIDNKTHIASGSSNSTTGSPAGIVCARLKSDGILDVNPMHPKLLALLDAGLSVEEIAAVGPEAKQKSKGFAWILATAEGRRRDAATVLPIPEKQTKPWYITASGIEAKAAELGIDGRMPHIKPEVFKRAGITDEMVRKANIDWSGR